MTQRQIKFRAWFQPKNIMVPNITLDGLKNWEGVNFYQWMQFTGLLDKNGKEIYEGDIVECEQMQGLGKFKGIVNYGVDWRKIGGHDLPDPRLYLDTRLFSKHNGSEHCIFHANPEIIGNIYENPELLTPPPSLEIEK